MVPGLAALSLLRREDRAALRLEEALWLSVALSVAASSWTALVLAELGRFSLPNAGALLAGGSALALALGRRRIAWPMPAATSSLLPALAVLATAFATQARPSEYVVGGRDPGAYVAAMGVIGRTGAIVHADPAVLSIPPEDVELFYRHPDKPAYSWSRFMGFDLESPATGRVVPQFFHLFPAFGAYLYSAMGMKGALATPPLFAILATVGVYLTFVRLLGPAPALLAALLLVANVVQVWFARWPVSENVSQFLLFGGLLALVHAEERASPALFAMAGTFFGLSLLVRIDSVLLAGPVLVYLLVRGAAGRMPGRLAVAFAVPLALLALHAAGHAVVFAPKYLKDVATRPYWNLGWLWLVPVVGVAVIGAAAFRHRSALRPRAASLGPRLRAVAAVAVVVLALYAFFVRPVLSAWAGGDGNDPRVSSFAAIGAALAERLGPGIVQALSFRRLAAHDAQAFYRLGWFVTPLGLALGTAGLVVALRRWEPRRLMLVLLVTAFGLFYFYKIRVYNDYFFALRRYLPIVLPGLLGFAALALHAAWRAGSWRRVAAGGAAGFLLVSFAGSSWPLVLARHPGGGRGHTDWAGSVRFVRDIARRFGPQDVVVFEHAQSIHLLSLPLWAAEGVNVLELARFDPDPEKLRHLVGAWSQRYRNIYFVHTWRTDLCGLFLERVSEHAFGTFEWERAYGEPPDRPVFQALHFRISRVVPPEQLRVPALPELDVGGSDDVQVSGFFDKEGGGERTYRWTGSCGSVVLPGARGAAAVAITTSVENRPPGLKPPLVDVSVSGQPIGSFVAEPRWTEHVLRLPDELPSGAPVLRLDVPAWRPANVKPGSTDTRDLGVMVDRIRLLESLPDDVP